jgi:hypothetical protein
VQSIKGKRHHARVHDDSASRQPSIIRSRYGSTHERSKRLSTIDFSAAASVARACAADSFHVHAAGSAAGSEAASSPAGLTRITSAMPDIARPRNRSGRRP